jgi:hypothetical protein
MGLALLLGACGAGDAGTASTTPDGTTPDTTVPPLEEPDTEVRVVLTISDEGGFVPVEWNLKRIPRYVVMSDGTVYYQGPVTMEYPGRALPNVQTGTISEEDRAVRGHRRTERQGHAQHRRRPRHGVRLHRR